MSFFLALDAGGTKTDYVLADETFELARVRTGTIKRMRTDPETAAQKSRFRSASAHSTQRRVHALNNANLRRTAGENVPLVADWLRGAITSRVSGELLLLGDVEIALDAAFLGQAGVLVLAGTGSNVAGRMSTGALISAGGWGPVLADQGSGHKIGLEGLRTAFLAKDEGRFTRLLQDVMDFWRLTNLDLLVEHANRIPPPNFSELTELVVRAAELGDEVAAEVLHKEGVALAYLARLLMRQRRRMAGNHEWVPPVAFAGSIMEKVPPVREAVIAAVQREFPHVRTLEGVVDPIAGAVWRARHQ